MRKFVSVVAVLAMLFALAMPAFAAGEGSSVSLSKDAAVQVADGIVVNPIPADAVDSYLTEVQKKSIESVAKAEAGADAVIGDVFEIHPEDFDDYSKGATITVVYEGDGEVAGVLYWSTERGEWDYAGATKNADGTYSATLKHFCDAALVITPKKAASAPSSKPAASGSSSPASPQTGFDPAGYMMVTAMLVLFAGLCFVKARKVTE